MALRTFTEKDVFPDRIVLYAQKGWGKTTLAAFAPKPIFLMSREETGYLTLRRNNLVPDAPFQVIERWEQLEAELRELVVKGPGDRETVVLDVLGGFERLCHEYVCEKKYNGDWGPKGFLNYMVGYRTGAAEMSRMLPILDELAMKKRLRIILLAHSRISQFDNPMGGKFDYYSPDLHDKTWEPINGWADALLFGRFRTVVAQVNGANKGVGRDERVLHCTRCDAFEAKNRHNLPTEIVMPKDPTQMWNAIGDKLAAAVDPNAARKAWANGMAEKAATPEGRAEIAAGGKASTVPAAPAAAAQAPTEPKNAQEQVGNMFELHKLVEEYKMQDLIPRWCAHFKVAALDNLTDAQVLSLIERIKKAKAAA